MNFQDQTLTCRDCGKPFTFTARDQQFYAEKGFTNVPTRCKDCRLNKKKVAEQKATQTLFKITCKKCGKVGEMATEPRKPDDVMCASCFYEEFRKTNGEPTAAAAATTRGRDAPVEGLAPSDE
jgi:hypothetical protein